jgi:arylsulfatase A-like enzyme
MGDTLNLLFLLVDCLRADVCHGSDRQVETPNLDALCRRGTAFTQAISVAGSTPVCLASLFTGVYPFVHGIRPLSLNRFHLSTTKLNPKCPTLAEILRESGYATCATMTGPILHVTDLDRGFEQYTHRATDDVYLHQRLGPDLGRLFQTLGSSGGKPWLLFVHLWELHAPRQVQPGFNSSRYGTNRYERAVSSLDHQLAAILQQVDFTDTLVIIHGDHGEGTGSLLEFMLHPVLHDRIGIDAMRLFYSLCFKWIHRYRALQNAHGLNLYDDIVRVPVVLVGPGIPRGRVIHEQVSQIDILPTLLELARVPPGLWPSMQGRSLLPLIAGNPWEERPVYAEAYSGKSISLRYLPIRRVKAGTFPKPPALAAIRASQWKCIWVPEDARIPTELYHLAEDPLERKNLFPERPEVAEELKAHLARLESGWQPGALQATMSPEEQAILEDRLRELGYL